MHNLGHALGYHHTDLRPDRDDYVDVNTQNAPTYLQINLRTKSYIVYENVTYSYASVMHSNAVVSVYLGTKR